MIFRLSFATCLVTHCPAASRFADAPEVRQRKESRSSYWFLPRTLSEYSPDRSGNLAAKSENARALAVADHLMCVSTPSSSALQAASPGGYAVRIHHSNESALLRDARYRAFATTVWYMRRLRFCATSILPQSLKRMYMLAMRPCHSIIDAI